MKLLDRIFKLEEINGANRCPTYLYRWTLITGRWETAEWYAKNCTKMILHPDTRAFIEQELVPKGSK